MPRTNPTETDPYNTHARWSEMPDRGAAAPSEFQQKIMDAVNEMVKQIFSQDASQ